MKRSFLLLMPLVLLLAAGAVEAQSIDGTVVRNPDDTVTYTIDLTGPPSDSMSAFLMPIVLQNWYIPGSVFAPSGWSSLYLPASGIWTYNSLTDSKSNLYGPNPQVWNNPQFVLKFEVDDLANAVKPGEKLGGFGFEALSSRVNGPALWRNASNLPFLPFDPPVPGPTPASAVPLPAAAPVGMLGLALVALVTAARRRRLTPGSASRRR